MARRHAGLPSWRSEVRRVPPGASQPRANRHPPGRNGRSEAAPDEWNFRSRCRTRGRFAPGLGFVSNSLRGSPLVPSHTWTRPPVAPQLDRWPLRSDPRRQLPKLPGGWRRLAPNSRRAVHPPDLGPAEVKTRRHGIRRGADGVVGPGGGQRFCPAWDPSAWATRARCKRCVRPRQAEPRSAEALTRRVKTCGIRGRASEGKICGHVVLWSHGQRRVCMHTFVCVCTQCVRVRNSRRVPRRAIFRTLLAYRAPRRTRTRVRARARSDPPGRAWAQGSIDRNASSLRTQGAPPAERRSTQGLAVERTRGLLDGQTVGGQDVRSGAASLPALPPSLPASLPPCLPPSLPPSPCLRFRFRASVWRGRARGR